MPISAAFIVPHPPVLLPAVGRGKESEVQKTIDSMKQVADKIAQIKPDTIILTSPHTIMYADYFHISPGIQAEGNFSQFGAGQTSISVEYDIDFVKKLCDLLQKNDFSAGTLGEREPELDHGTMVPLYFINEKYKDYKLVRIGLSGLTLPEHYRFGQFINQIAQESEKNIVFIASGDLSHKVSENGPYGFAEEGVVFDKLVTEAMASGDFLQFLTFDDALTESAAECGLRSFVIMAGVFDGKKVESELLSYEGTLGVGYGIAAFIPDGEDKRRKFLDIYDIMLKEQLKSVKNQEDPYVRLARYSLETYVNSGTRAKLPDNLPNEMITQRAGTFVSLKMQGSLRGCIGTIAPVQDSIGEEILQNAVSAGTEDPRFEPITADELPFITYSVDVLSPPEPIDSVDALDVKQYGVIVSNGYKRGLLLPNLEGVNKVSEQVSIALEKAGIGEEEDFQLERFKVVRHK